MKRRRFLQLAAGAAAGAVVEHSSPHAEAARLSLSPAEPGKPLAMLLERRSDGSHQWSVQEGSTQGRSYQAKETLFLEPGRYRLRMMNATDSARSISLRNHHFEITRLHQAPVSGIFQRSIHLDRYNVVEADVVLRFPQPLVVN